MAAKKSKSKNNKNIKKDDLNKKINATTNGHNSNTSKKNNNNNNINKKNSSSKKNNNSRNNNIKKVNKNKPATDENIKKVDNTKNNTKSNNSNKQQNKKTDNNNAKSKNNNSSNKQTQNNKKSTNKNTNAKPVNKDTEEKKKEIPTSTKKDEVKDMPIPREEEKTSETDYDFEVITDTYKKEKDPIKTPNKVTNNTKSLLNLIKIAFLYICKGFLISVKFIKNFIIKQYNGIRRKRNNKKSINAIRREEIDSSPLVLKRYRDYPIYGYLYVFLANRIRVIKFDMKNFKKKFKYGTLKDKILIILMIILIVGFSILVAFCVYVAITAPEVTEEKLYRNTTTVLLDTNDKEFGRIGLENRENVSYDELPEVLIDAIVATEDSRFFQHNGIDIARFTKATIGQLLGRPDAGGGSTLTMQVSKKAATSSVSSGIKGIIRKFTDIYLSVFVIEQKYTKEQIMEFYVNINFLGARSYGVEQASKTYFGKSVSELTLTEAALIAGLFQAPDYLNPYNNPEGAEERRNTVLNLMERHGYINKEEKEAAQAVPVSTMLVQKDSSGNINEHQGFIDTLVTDVYNKTGFNPYNTSMTIHTTYNTDKQKVINDVYENYKFQDDFVQIGIAVVDVDTGALVAVGTGRNKTGALETNYAMIHRHPGSIAKPVLDYGPAFEYLGWGTGNTVIDDEYGYSSGGEMKNFDNKFKGILTVKKALAQSRNVPALYTFQQTTNEQKLEFSQGLGWKPETTPNGTLLESDSIGGFEPGVSPIEAAAAYATFARGGVYIEPYTYTSIEFSDSDDVIEFTPKKKNVMSEETAYLINTILLYAVKNGPVVAGSVSGTDIAGKTGTSTLSSAAIKSVGLSSKLNIVGDSWEVTYSPDYAIALWQGYEPRLTKEHYLLNSKAVKTRNGVTKALNNGTFTINGKSKKLNDGIFEKNSRFKKPDGITSVTVELETDPIQLASPYTPDDLKSTEYYKKGTEPTEVSNRFNTLSDPSNLRYSSTSTSVSLSWDPVPIPDAINQTYLKEYFENSAVYKTWADKYYNRRIQYNNATFGAFGYHVYLVNSTGTYDLGFTTNSYFTANVQFDSTTRFIVKTSYQKFTANQSPGVSVNVEPNSESTYVPPTTPTEKPTTESTRLSIIYKGRSSCSTLSDYNALGNSIADKITIEANGQDVTNQANININCYLADDDNDMGGHCSSMTADKAYRLEITAVYKNVRRMAVVNIKPRC